MHPTGLDTAAARSTAVGPTVAFDAKRPPKKCPF